MDIQMILDTWKPKKQNTMAGVELWDGKAEHFSANELPTAENSLGMQIIMREGMVKKDTCVLDVGCGGGRFAFALEALGANVAATDFSPRMIEEAEKQRALRHSNVSFSVNDWHTLDLADKRWKKQFDLVLANMTPAVMSAETFFKLSEASRNWCLMVKPARRANSILDELECIVGAEKDSKRLDETIAYSFDLLWLSGYKPKLEYDDQVREHNLPLETAIREYTLRLSTANDLTEKGKAAIRAYLNGVSENGVVHECAQTSIVAMYWRV
ncbi:MAG: class I SAM-dependent methyltransferase [Oscillospiraceae bacterium]